jgi:hypothetical protein
MTSIRNWLFAAAALVLFAAPAQAAPPLEAYGRLPAVELMRLSPSGTRFAFVTVVGEKRELVVAGVDDGKPLVAAVIGDTKVTDIEWAGDDHVLVTASATVDLGVEFAVPRDEWSGVAVFNINGGKSFTVFGGSQEVAHAVFGTLGARQVDGHWYGYFAGITLLQMRGADPVLDSGSPDLYQVDLDTGGARLVAHGGQQRAGWLIGPKGEIVARSTMIRSVENGASSRGIGARRLF